MSSARLYFHLSGLSRLSTQEARLLGVHSSEIPVHPQSSQGTKDEELQRLVKTASLIGAYALAVAWSVWFAVHLLILIVRRWIYQHGRAERAACHCIRDGSDPSLAIDLGWI